MSNQEFSLSYNDIAIGSCDLFKDTLEVFDDFKNKQESIRNNVFWYVKVLYSESIFNTLYIKIKYKY